MHPPLLLFIFLCSLMIQPLAITASPGSHDTASIYRQLQELVEHEDANDTDELYWLHTAVEQRFPLTDHMRQRLHALHDKKIKLIVQASEMPPPDWGLDWDQGFDLLLPHLSSGMAGSRMLAAHFQLQIEVGDLREIKNTFSACQTMADHYREDPCVISSLVSMSMQKTLEKRVMNQLDHGQITPDVAKALIPLLSRDRHDFGLADALARERMMTSEWLVGELDLSDDPDQPLQDAQINTMQLIMSVTNDSSDMSKWTTGDVRNAIEDLDAFYSQIIATAKEDDWEAALQSAEAAQATLLKDGEAHALVRMLAMDVSSLFSKRIEYENERVALLDRLEQCAQGLDTMLPNAAWHWIKAASIAMSTDSAWIDDEARLETINSLLDTSMTFRDAEYPPPWDGYLEASVPWWLQGQWRLASGLLDRASRSMNAGDVSNVVNDLDICLRIAAALSDHPTIASSLLAGHIINRSSALIVSANEADLLDQDDRKKLRQRLRTLNARDPGGLRHAAAHTRNRLQSILEYDFRNMDVPPMPMQDGALLNAIAWMRGASTNATDPRIFVVPDLESIDSQIVMIDHMTLNGWHELGTSMETHTPFEALGEIDIELAADTMGHAIHRADTSLRTR